MKGKRTKLPPGWDDLTGRQQAKHAKNLCVEPHCRNRSERHGNGTFLLRCPTCRSRKYTEAHPIRVKFLNLKKSAKRRGIAFLVTWPFFEKLAAAGGYNRFTPAKDAMTLSVNRIPEESPYSDGTIEIIPLGENSRLSNEYRKSVRAGHVAARIAGYG